MRMCLAWRVASAEVQLPTAEEWPVRDVWRLQKLSTTLVDMNAFGPARWSSRSGQGQGSRSGDGARAVQHPVPQQNPVSVPQQQVPVVGGADTSALLSAKAIICENMPARTRLAIKLAKTSVRIAQ